MASLALTLGPRSFLDPCAASLSPRSIVRFRTRYGSRAGVCTSWLDRLVQPLTTGEEPNMSNSGMMRPANSLKVPVFIKR